MIRKTLNLFEVASLCVHKQHIALYNEITRDTGEPAWDPEVEGVRMVTITYLGVNWMFYAKGSYIIDSDMDDL